ncbi:MAG TPA: hypothetical protein VFV78_06265, partial [Vicinamibacterales bacterium]|nr:hypothetical protein [Vicinamibacterales bacterium]
MIDATVRRGAGGAVYLKSSQTLGRYPVRITDCLDRWAREAPERTFLAERPRSPIPDPRSPLPAQHTDRDWRRLTYAETRAQVRNIAQALLARELSSDRPILILSGNS